MQNCHYLKYLSSWTLLILLKLLQWRSHTLWWSCTPFPAVSVVFICSALCPDFCSSRIVCRPLLLMIMCSSARLIEHSLHGSRIRPITPPLDSLLQGHLLIWPPRVSRLSITLCFPTLTVAAAAAAHILLLFIDTPSVGGAFSFLLSYIHVGLCSRLLSLSCHTAWISQQLMTQYGMWMQSFCHLGFALRNKEHPTTWFRNFRNISLFLQCLQVISPARFC